MVQKNDIVVKKKRQTGRKLRRKILKSHHFGFAMIGILCEVDISEELIEEDVILTDMALYGRRVDVFTEMIAEISELNICEIREAIVSSKFLNDRDGVEVIVEAIVRTAGIRPNAQTLLLLLISYLSADKEFESVMINRLSLFPENCEYLSYMLLRSKPEEIVRIANEFISDAAFFWFAPQIERINEQGFNSKLLALRARSTDDLKVRGFLVLYETLRMDNWQVHACIVAKGTNPDSRAMAIRYDCLDELQHIAGKEMFDYNQRIEICPYERCNFVNHRPTLIQYAAFYGAVKCFKWLLFGGADISLKDDPRWGDEKRCEGKNLLEYAIAGGNTEIIRLIEHAKDQFIPECIDVAVKFKRHAIEEWLKMRI